MIQTKRIIFLTYHGAELLDVTGPAAVFAAASQVDPSAVYECLTVSARGGLVRHSCGIEIETQKISEVPFRPMDTVLVVGALRRPLVRAMKDGSLRRAVTEASMVCTRYGSICTGSFILAAADLLDEKSAATHWAARSKLAEYANNGLVNPDALYVRDGRLWTSAGVTTGIDMALAMLEEDHGPTVKAKVARGLVLYAHRPGYQTQFSDVLAAQIRVEIQYAGLIDWLMSRLDQSIRVEDMACFAGMSERSFFRQFKALFDISPGKFLEHLKLDHARILIESGEAVTIAGSQVGFRSPSAFRTAFKGRFGVTPRHHGEMHHEKGRLGQRSGSLDKTGAA